MGVRTQPHAGTVMGRLLDNWTHQEGLGISGCLCSCFILFRASQLKHRPGLVLLTIFLSFHLSPHKTPRSLHLQLSIPYLTISILVHLQTKTKQTHTHTNPLVNPPPTCVSPSSQLLSSSPPSLDRMLSMILPVVPDRFFLASTLPVLVR